jgi:hypothetical protein
MTAILIFAEHAVQLIYYLGSSGICHPHGSTYKVAYPDLLAPEVK